MAVSIIDQLQEKDRQERTGDKEWFEKKAYVFVINAPSRKGGPVGDTGQAVFPLPIGPESLIYDLPFAAEVTPLQERGVIADEAGFVLGEITIDATTGFKLRMAKDRSQPVNGAFTSELASERGADNELISGQLHFWRLAGRCFEGYSQLKQDPLTAEKTTMEFHSLRDRLHLLVVPRSFRLSRNASRERVTYRFQVRLTVVGKAKGAKPRIKGETRDFLDKTRDGIALVRRSVQSLSATIDDATAASDAFRRQLSTALSVIDDVRSIVTSANALLEGTKRYLDLPKQAITSVAEGVEEVATTADLLELDPTLRASMRSVADDLHRLAVGATDYYAPGYADDADDYNTATNRTGQNKSETLDAERDSAASEATDAQGTQSFEQTFGGSVQPGDSKRSVIDDRESRLTAQYNGFDEVVVVRGDTLASLAAKHLGDPAKAIVLALVNQLRPPWITSGARLPGTLQPSDRILIPVADTATPNQTRSTGNATLGESQIDEHLGRDWKMVKIGRQFDLAVDTAHGSDDLDTIAGVPNVLQAIDSRLRTEQGENILFPDYGLPRLVGQLELDPGRFQLQQQLLDDNRIESVLAATLNRDKDTVTFDATVQLRGSDTPRTISRVLS